MLIPAELIALCIIVIIVFLQKRPPAQKFRQLKIAVGLFALIQVGFYLVGAIAFYFIQKKLTEDQQIIVAFCVLGTTLLAGLAGSLYLSFKAIRRHFPPEVPIDELLAPEEH